MEAWQSGHRPADKASDIHRYRSTPKLMIEQFSKRWPIFAANLGPQI